MDFKAHLHRNFLPQSVNGRATIMLAVLFPHLLFTPLTGKESHIKMTEIAMHVTPDWITRTLGSLLAHVVLALGLTLLTTQALHSGAK